MSEVTVKRVCKPGWKNCQMPELRQRIAGLEAEVGEISQNVCDECSPEDYGWNYNAVEGRVPCVCIAESGAYQELKSAYDHTVEDNVDLVAKLDDATEQMDWIKKHHIQVYMMATQEAGE